MYTCVLPDQHNTVTMGGQGKSIWRKYCNEIKEVNIKQIWGSHRAVPEDVSIVGCDAVFGDWLQL